MNIKHIVLIISVFILCGIPTSGLPGLVNGGFETGDYSGWALSGCALCGEVGVGTVEFPYDIFSTGTIPLPTVLNNISYYYDYTPINHNPAEESYFLSINGVVGTPYSDIIGPDGKVYVCGNPYSVTLSQSINIDKGNVLSGWTSIYTSDYPPYDYDATWVYIKGNGIEAMPIYLSAKTAYDYYDSVGEALPWFYWSWMAPMSGIYDLSLNLRNDDQEDSDGLHDGIRLTRVSEPSTMLLLGSGLLGLVGYSRRRFKK